MKTTPTALRPIWSVISRRTAATALRLKLFGGKLTQGGSFVATHGLWAGIPLGFFESLRKDKIVLGGLRESPLTEEPHSVDLGLWTLDAGKLNSAKG